MRRQFLTLLLSAFTAVTAVSAAAQENEFGSETRLYEDDAWFDISEWFDGNDYNPTDEALGRWDDETYESTEAGISTDYDEDEEYGYYDDQTNADWYYDYNYQDYTDYNDFDADGLYEISSHYYDYDDDGFYDAYVTYGDTDGDGLFESYAYYSFADRDDQAQRKQEARKQATENMANRSGKVSSVSGQVVAVKKVKARGSEHLVAHVQPSQQADKLIVDLGPANRLNVQLKENESLTARGPVTKVGEKNVLLARQIEHQGKSIHISRSPHFVQGRVADQMKAQVRGQQHQFVKVETQQGKKALVDLGPAEKLKVNLQNANQVEISGVAIKVDQRPVLLASSLTVNGETINIRRMNQGQQPGQQSNRGTVRGAARTGQESNQ